MSQISWKRYKNSYIHFTWKLKRCRCNTLCEVAHNIFTIVEAISHDVSPPPQGFHDRLTAVQMSRQSNQTSKSGRNRENQLQTSHSHLLKNTETFKGKYTAMTLHDRRWRWQKLNKLSNPGKHNLKQEERSLPFWSILSIRDVTWSWGINHQTHL